MKRENSATALSYPGVKLWYIYPGISPSLKSLGPEMSSDFEPITVAESPGVDWGRAQYIYYFLRNLYWKIFKVNG